MKMKVLVLNADYQPLNVTSLKRGFKLVYKGKAEIIKDDTNLPIITQDGTVYQRPTIIRLVRYISAPFRKVQLTRHNVFRRDGHACVYCGSKKELTLDHVLPKSRGGKNTWQNLTTCCKTCNNKKDNKTPEEAGLSMMIKPYRPTYVQFINNIKSDKPNSWKKYFK